MTYSAWSEGTSPPARLSTAPPISDHLTDMASTQPPTHDPALASASTATQPPSAAQPPAGAAPSALPSALLATMGQEQLAVLLKHIPDLLNRVSTFIVISIIPPSCASSPFGCTPTVAPRCVGHALHVIEGIGHVCRADREQRVRRTSATAR